MLYCISMMQFIKYFIYTIIGISILAGGLYIVNSREHAPMAQESITEFSMVAPTEMSAAGLLLQHSEQNNIVIEYKDYGGEMGLFIQSVGGVPSIGNTNTTKWWQFWVNGEYSTLGASSVMVEEGDEVVWSYTSSQQ